MPQVSEVRRLNWGCGSHVQPGWINTDVKAAPEVDLVADIRKGLPLDDDSIEYAVSVHALPELSYDEVVPALQELKRVLKPGGVLRLVLPDLQKAIDAYIEGNDRYFHLVEDDVTTLGGRLVTQILWYGYSRTLFTSDFTAELLTEAGYVDLALCQPHQTASGFADIVELDNREEESFYMEGIKPAGFGSTPRGYTRRPPMKANLEVLDVSAAVQGESPLKAAHLDGPVAGYRRDGDSLRIVGWVVGDESPAREVEIVSDHTVVGRAPVNVVRPGVADQFPGHPGTDAAGFDMTLAAKGKGVSDLLVSAVLEDGTRAALGTIRVDITRYGMLSRLFG
jgi:methyltransferase family protein